MFSRNNPKDHHSAKYFPSNDYCTCLLGFDWKFCVFFMRLKKRLIAYLLNEEKEGEELGHQYFVLHPFYRKGVLFLASYQKLR